MVLLWLIDMLLHLHLYSGGHHNLYRCKTLNIYLKCCSKCKSRDSFKICSSWGFQNTPYMFKLIEFWLRYLRSKTNDMILKITNKLIEIGENLMKSIHLSQKYLIQHPKHLIGLLRMIFLDIDVPKSNQNNFCYNKFSFHEIFLYLYQFTGFF